MSGKPPKRTIDGEWLRRAFDAQGVSANDVARQQGIKPDKYYRHFSDKAHLSSESLAELARQFPTMNMRYVLTGQGHPLLTTPPASA